MQRFLILDDHTDNMFRDRSDAGRQLAEVLTAQGIPSGVVLGLPRGGVVVGYPIARDLGMPLDVVVVRKLGAPNQRELGIGAIGEHDTRWLNHDLIKQIGLHEHQIYLVEDEERHELQRRSDVYRAIRPALDLTGRTAILVDDGLATGATARAAIATARRRNAERIMLAVPVASTTAARELDDECDGVICLVKPRRFMAVGQWYHDFRQTPETEVIRLLKKHLQIAPQ